MSSDKIRKTLLAHSCALFITLTAVGMLAPTAHAVEPCVGVSVPSPSSKTGVTVSVPVNVTEMATLGARSADFTITYDAARLNYSGAALGAVGTSNGGGRVLTVNSSTPGNLAVSVFGSAEFQGSGVFVNLSFTVTGPPATTAPVSFSSFTFNEGTPCNTTSNGVVSIVSGAISGKVTYGNALGSPAPPRAVPGVTLNADGVIDRSAVTGNTGGYFIDGMGAGAYTVTPSKSGDTLGAISGTDAADIAGHVVGLAPQLTGHRAMVADVSGNGAITSFDAAMIASFVVGLEEETGTTGDWIFVDEDTSYANVNIDYAEQNYVALLMGDVSGNWDHPLGDPNLTFEVESDPLKISAARISASPGTSITVPVKIGDTTGRGIRAYEFELHYDADVLQPAAVAASLAGTISSGKVLTVNANKRGVLRLVTFGAEAFKGDGELVNLHFHVVGTVGLSSELKWDRFRLNEGGISFKTESGEVAVAASTENGGIGGRLVDSRGSGVARALVTVTDTNGHSRAVLTSSLGYFQISGLELGETYTVRAESKRYRFAAQSISISGANAVELTMVGLE